MNFKIKNYLPIIILVILAFSSQAFAQDKPIVIQQNPR